MSAFEKDRQRTGYIYLAYVWGFAAVLALVATIMYTYQGQYGTASVWFAVMWLDIACAYINWLVGKED